MCEKLFMLPKTQEEQKNTYIYNYKKKEKNRINKERKKSYFC